ncbi:MAG: hypothetical protein AAF587_42895 [Bacteroidota bacterium]
MSRLLISLIALLWVVPLLSQSPFDIELVVPISTPEGKREIAMDRYPRIHVLLINRSEDQQRIWKDWNTWGYFNLQLNWINNNKTYAIRRQPPEVWDGDFPDFWVVEAGETLVLEIDLTSGQWDGFPDLYGDMIEARMTATYQNKPDPLAQEFDIWVGKLVSKEVQVVFR